MKIFGQSIIAASMLVLLAAAGSAQDAQKPVPKKVPAMTTDDVMGDRAAPLVTDEPDGTVAGGQPTTKPKQGAEKGVSPAEAAWREKLKAARDRAQAVEHQADQTELDITGLRNKIGDPGQDANSRNDLVAEMDSMGKKLADLRAEQEQAKGAVSALLDEGRDHGFTEAPEAGPTKDGAPNKDYYKTKYAELQQQLSDAQKKAEIYENRIRDINARISSDSRGGDNFAIGKLQQEKQTAQDSLDDAQAAVEKAQQDLNDLLEQARQAGVPPGVFRE